MKSRISFCVAAIVALVLIFSAVPTSATERRDPLMMQDTVQTTPSARTAESSKKNMQHKKHARHAKHGQAEHSSKTAAQQKTGVAK